MYIYIYIYVQCICVVYFCFLFLQSFMVNSVCNNFLPAAAADPLAHHDLQTGLQSTILRWSGGTQPGQRLLSDHRPQAVFRPVWPQGERTEGWIHCWRPEGAIPRLGEHLTSTPSPTSPWGWTFSWIQGCFDIIQLRICILREKPPTSVRKWQLTNIQARVGQKLYETLIVLDQDWANFFTGGSQRIVKMGRGAGAVEEKHIMDYVESFRFSSNWKWSKAKLQRLWGPTLLSSLLKWLLKKWEDGSNAAVLSLTL